MLKGSSRRVQGIVSPVVELSVPCLPEYVSVVRLAVLGLCGRVSLSYDEVEDLRLAVGEACATSVYRAVQAKVDDARIKLTGSIDDSEIVLEIRDNVPVPPDTTPATEPDLTADFDDQHFRISLMQLLVDAVDIQESEDGGQLVRLVKRCGPANEPKA